MYPARAKALDSKLFCNSERFSSMIACLLVSSSSGFSSNRFVMASRGLTTNGEKTYAKEF
jgi:hypothetical protein